MTEALLFARPEAWPLLLAAPLAWGVLWLRDRLRDRRLTRLAGPRMAALSAERGVGRRAIARGAFACGVLLAAAAALHPVWGADVAEEEQRGVDLVVCLDVSRSMLARDVAPDRLTRAKQEIRALSAAARGDRFGLVVFAGEARALVPLTEDAASFAHLADLADPTSVGRGGTDLGAALEAGLALLERRGESGDLRPAVILLLTDGEDLGDRGAAAAQRAREMDVRVHTVGYGTALGGKVVLEGERGTTFLKDRGGRDVVSALDAPGLSRIASATGGTFRPADAEGGTLGALYRDQVLPLPRLTFASEHLRRQENRFQLPLLLGLLLGLVDFGLPRRRRTRAGDTRFSPARAAAVLALLSLPLLAACGAPEDAASREAVAALRAGRFDEAAASAKRLVDSPDPPTAALGYFVRGNVAFARSVALETETGPAAEAASRNEAATASTEDALAAWRMAAASRADWPEARRNVERAILRLERLRERRGAGGTRPGESVTVPGRVPKPPAPAEGTDAPSDPPPSPPPPPTPPSGAGTPEPVPEDGTQVATTELPAAEVARLFEVLREKERQRRQVREAQRAGAAPGSAVERDW